MNKALALVSPKTIIDLYLSGRKTEDIAKSYGVTRQGLGYHLRKHAEEDWKEAQVILAIERKDIAEHGLETATDALSLARAREQLRSAQWDLERVYNRIYGQKQELTGKDGGPVTIEIVTFASTQVEQQPIADAHSTAPLPIK